MTDAVTDLAHDHGELNRKVLDLAAIVDGRQTPSDEDLVVELRDLREQMFFHFAREEEGLFPFVAELLPEYEARVTEMTLAHDAICGAVARMVHIAATPTDDRARKLRDVFERFESAYAAHAKTEAELFVALEKRLDAAQRARLQALVDDL